MASASLTQETKDTVPEPVAVVNAGPQEAYPYKAEALYACELFWAI